MTRQYGLHLVSKWSSTSAMTNNTGAGKNSWTSKQRRSPMPLISPGLWPTSLICICVFADKRTHADKRAQLLMSWSWKPSITFAGMWPKHLKWFLQKPDPFLMAMIVDRVSRLGSIHHCSSQPYHLVIWRVMYFWKACYEVSVNQETAAREECV